MGTVIRRAEQRDIPPMAVIRARRGGTQDYWVERIGQYLASEYSPQKALAARVVFVAEDSGEVVGLAAGHQTRRYDCDGELQWIDVVEERRREGIAAKLLASVGKWFVRQGLKRICVDVEPGNSPARIFYTKHGAAPLNPHWMVWEDAQSMNRASQRR